MIKITPEYLASQDLSPTIVERFWKYVHKTESCWIWTGAIEKGLGRMVNHVETNARTSAHRVSWLLHHGPIPDGIQIMHTCQNLACVNPEHLVHRQKPHPNPTLAAEGFSETFPERFWSKVRKTDGCWFWTGKPGEGGYGNIKRGSRTSGDIGAHAASWIIHFGLIPEGVEVCHSCDVNYPPGDISYRLCVCPHHLHLGTHKINIQEMVDKGRVAKGERNHSILTTEQVLEIRRLHDKNVRGYGCKALGRAFGVSYTTIRKIVRRQKWSHI